MPVTNRRFKSVPCTAVYPKRKMSVPAPNKGSKRSSPSRFLMGDDIGIRLYRAAVEARTSNQADGTRPPQNGRIKRSMSVRQKGKVAAEDSLEERYVEQQERLKKMKEEEEDRVRKECTFTPQICQKSAKMSRRSKSMCGSRIEIDRDLNNDSDFDTSVFNALYCQTQRLQQTAEAKIPEECTFKPNVIRSFTYKHPKQKEYVSQPVAERLVKSKSFHDLAVKKAREERDLKELTIDQKTGQQLYKPKITRGPKKVGDQSKPLHERLHKDCYLEKKRAEAESRAKRRWQDLKAKTYSMQRSEKLLNVARKQKCAELFNLLDPDGCGSISSGHIKLDCKLSDNIRGRLVVEGARSVGAGTIGDGREEGDFDLRDLRELHGRLVFQVDTAAGEDDGRWAQEGVRCGAGEKVFVCGMLMSAIVTLIIAKHKRQVKVIRYPQAAPDADHLRTD